CSKAGPLAAGSGTSGTKVTLLLAGPPPGAPKPQVGRYVGSVPDRLGYQASLKVITNAPSAGLGDLSDSSKRPQIGWFTWFQDSPTPSNFIEPLLTCRSFVPRSQDNLNITDVPHRGIPSENAHAAAPPLREPTTPDELP